MSTTSLKLPEELKQRAAAAAQTQGLSPHAFMIQAIDQAASAAEQRAAFVADAKRAREQMLKSGKGFAAEEVGAYLKARIAGKEALETESRVLARLIYSGQAVDDLDRLTDFLLQSDPRAALETVDLIAEAVGTLKRHPLIGRPVDGELRELVISRGRTGYVALYSFEEAQDAILILAIRHQREAGYWPEGQ